MDISRINATNKNPSGDNQKQEYFLNFQNFDFHKNLMILNTKKILHPTQDINY